MVIPCLLILMCSDGILALCDDVGASFEMLGHGVARTFTVLPS